MDWLGGLRRFLVARAPRRRARPRSLRPAAAVACGLGLGAFVLGAGCYDTGDGTDPPIDQLYFPVGVAVSHGGSTLFIANSDFDLQYNGGTLQSYDLRLIRDRTVIAIKDPAHPILLLERPAGEAPPLGEELAPPVKSQGYWRDGVVIGAFATDLLLSPTPRQLVVQLPKFETDGHACKDVVADCCPTVGGEIFKDCCPNDECRNKARFRLECAPSASGPGDTTCGVRPGDRQFDRLFMPVRGNATLTWATVERDQPNTSPDGTWRLQCGRDPDGRCDHAHQVGGDPAEPGNTRGLTMPGEPFGMTMSEDGESIVITHQNDTKTSLFSTGLRREQDDFVDTSPDPRDRPSIQFVVDQLPVGGVGIANIPHDRDAFVRNTLALPRPAFLETSRAVARVSLIRQYSDEFAGSQPSILRPFLALENSFPVTATAGGTDSRGIAIDPTPRMACKALVKPVDATRTQAVVDEELRACARKPARVFIANRTPPSLLVGDVGVTEGEDGAYDADRLIIHTSLPLSTGPSQVFLAPIVDRDGAYALRVFVVCFDAATVFVFDPEAGVLENVIRVAPGPFAMAFDPFTMEQVARHDQVPCATIRTGDDALDPKRCDDVDTVLPPRDLDPKAPPDQDPTAKERHARRYRFAYLASFTQSFLQVLDLDNRQPNRATFEHVVFTLGVPTNPKGT